MIKSDTVNSVNTFTKVTTSKLFWVVSFSLLTAVAAQITIPAKPVPFTLQTMMVILSGAFLGARYGAYSQILYLAMGVVGLPVFAYTPEAGWGLMRLFGPTGGYLLAFPIGAFLTGYFIEKNSSYIFVVIAMLAGDLAIILSGVLYLNVFFIKNLSDAFVAGGLVFFVWTLVKIMIAASVFSGFKKAVRKF